MDNSSPIYTEIFFPISRADMEARGWDQLDFVWWAAMPTLTTQLWHRHHQPPAGGRGL
mgnify:CR=1 FL=1